MSAQIDAPKYTYLKRGVYYFVMLLIVAVSSGFVSSSYGKNWNAGSSDQLPTTWSAWDWDVSCSVDSGAISFSKGKAVFTQSKNRCAPVGPMAQRAEINTKKLKLLSLFKSHSKVNSATQPNSPTSSLFFKSMMGGTLVLPRLCLMWTGRVVYTSRVPNKLSHGTDFLNTWKSVLIQT